MKLNLRKYSTINIEGIDFPIRTLSLAEELAIKITPTVKFPSKIEVLSEKDKQDLQSQDPNYNPKQFPVTKVIDTQSEQYKIYTEEKEKYGRILESAKYIDLNKVMDGQPFHKTLGVDNPKDWLQVCKALDDAGFSYAHAEQIIIEVNAIRKQGLFERIGQLQEITSMPIDELIDALEKVLGDKNLEQEIALNKIQELLDEQI